VVLKTGLPDGTHLAAFDREAEARETFTTYAREERAIAPDACIDVAEADGRRLFGFVELDLGTMAHRQLKAKATGYGEYARLEAWRHRNPFCPALLFITTSEKRARSFLAASEREIGARMLVACIGLARDLRRCIVAPEWMVGDGEQATDLLAILRAARRPYDEEEAREDAQRREEGAERDRLRSDPETLAERLRGELRYGWGSDQLGQPATDALRLSLEGKGGALDEIERRALEAVGGMLAEPIDARLADREPTPSEREALAALVAHHRAGQLARLEEVVGRFGEGPKVRQRRRWLESGELMSADSVDELPRDGEQDREGAAEQERLRRDYLRWREWEAKRLAKLQGFIARHRTGHDAFLAEVDRGALRGDRLSRPRAQAPPWRSAPRCRALPFLRGGDAERAANRAGEIDLRSGCDGATPSGRIAARRRRDHEGRQHKMAAGELKPTMSIEHTEPGSALDDQLRREQAKAIFDLLADQ